MRFSRPGTGNWQVRQQRRLLALGIYVASLVVLSASVTGSFVPPIDSRGLWFYSAAAALLLGEYLVEPYFSRPADAVANGVALGLGLLTATGADAVVGPDEFAAGRIALAIYALGVIVTGIVAIIWKDSGKRRRRVAALASRIASSIGRAKWVFSAALFGAAYAGYADEPGRLSALYLSWFVIVAVRPVEWLMRLVGRPDGRSRAHAQILRAIDPNIVVLRLPEGTVVGLGDGVVLNGTTSGTVVDVTELAPSPIVRVSLSGSPSLSSSPSIEITRTTDQLVIGHIDVGTDLETIRVRTVPQAGARGLAEGRLLEVGIGGHQALYQIIAAHIASQLEASLGRQTVTVEARKLGRWDPASTTFEVVEWLPEPGAGVQILHEEAPKIDPGTFVGHVPGTSFGVKIDPHAVVTHNTAILGILGSGKSHLTYELIWRMLDQGIRVIVLDITGRYSDHFRRVINSDLERELARRINDAIAADLDSTSVRNNEAGNVLAFREKLSGLVSWFLRADGRLLVVNPNGFRAKRMEGRPFSGSAQVLVEVTMVEVTRMIAELLLEQLQQMDPIEDEKARVCLVLEEAHSLVPEWNSATNDSDRQAVNGTARAILQGRKYGFGTVLVTQRTANVTKSILNQCNTVFGLRAFDATGMGFLENYVGPSYARVLASLRDRQAVVYGRASSCRAPLLITLNDANDLDRAFLTSRLAGIPVMSRPRGWTEPQQEEPQQEEPQEEEHQEEEPQQEAPQEEAPREEAPF